MVTLADALRQFGTVYLAQHSLTTPQSKARRAICACRTAALGGQRLLCDSCAHSHWQYHSCRNRHCPQCGARAKDTWLQARLAELLPVPYTHLVFTLPHSLNALYGQHPRWVIDTLFSCTARTLTEFAANGKWFAEAGGTPAFTLVLHTWSQDLQRHLHLHAVMACGALAGDGRWLTPARRPDFLFPVHALSKVFRGKFIAALTAARRDGALPRDPHGLPGQWRDRQRQLYRCPWVVYAKTPLPGPAQVLEYLSRYTHRTAIGNERIRAVDARQVAFTVRADGHGGKRLLRLHGVEFLRRFLLHILPTGIKRVRHYGILAPAAKQLRLNAARLALHMPIPAPPVNESCHAFMQRVTRCDLVRCPCCQHGTLHVVETLPGRLRLPEPGQRASATIRGPP